MEIKLNSQDIGLKFDINKFQWDPHSYEMIVWEEQVTFFYKSKEEQVTHDILPKNVLKLKPL